MSEYKQQIHKSRLDDDCAQQCRSTEAKEFLKLVMSRTKRIFLSEYSGSSFGVLWHLIKPAAILSIYTVVFGTFLRVRPDVDGIPYVLYLCSALIPWFAFRDVVVKASTCLVRNKNYLRRLMVPEELFVMEAVLQGIISFFFSSSLTLVLMLAFGEDPSWTWLLVVPVCALMMGSCGGIGLILAALVPLFSDLSQVIQIVLRPMFWMTPIIYPISQVPDGSLKVIVWMQPMTPYVQSVRQVLFYGTVPDIKLWALMIIWTVASILVGRFTLCRLRSAVRDSL